jgi:hypothetical protein
MAKEMMPPNNSLHLTRGADAPLAGELRRWMARVWCERNLF